MLYTDLEKNVKNQEVLMGQGEQTENVLNVRALLDALHATLTLFCHTLTFYRLNLLLSARGKLRNALYQLFIHVCAALIAKAPSRRSEQNRRSREFARKIAEV